MDEGGRVISRTSESIDKRLRELWRNSKLFRFAVAWLVTTIAHTFLFDLADRGQLGELLGMLIFVTSGFGFVSLLLLGQFGLGALAGLAPGLFSAFAVLPWVLIAGGLLSEHRETRRSAAIYVFFAISLVATIMLGLSI